MPDLTDFSKRPETIAGLSEFAWEVPSIFLLLVSEQPCACRSLVSEGEDFPIPALAGPRAVGERRARHLLSCMVESGVFPDTRYLEACRQNVENHLRDTPSDFVVLETAEVDALSAETATEFDDAIKSHIASATRLAALVDIMTPQTVSAHVEPGGFLHNVVAPDGTVDDMRNDRPVLPLGLGDWSNTLYFAPFNRRQWAEQNL